jgi:predicted DNA binding protein
MTVITKTYFSHPDMALAHTIRTLSAVSIKVIPEAGTDPEHNMYFFLVEGGSTTAFESALEADHTVSEAQLMSEYEDQRIYGIVFTTETKLLAPKVTEVGGIALEARSGNDGWIERWQLADRQSLNAVWTYAKEHSFSFEVLELYQIDDDAFGEGFDLTEQQRAALEVAYSGGYFKEPRGMTLVELADELDISPSAASGRLRRGLTKLLGATIIESE